MDIATLAAAKTYTNNKVEEIINGGDASVVDPTLSLSGAAADAKVTGDRLDLLENYVTPQMFGAKADGVTDDTAAIQLMFNNVAGVGKVYFPHGNYLTTASLVVEKVPDIEMDGMILSNHSGVALTLGRSDVYTMNKIIKLKLKKQGTALEKGSIGVVICAAARNTFYLDYINRFETNVKLFSTTIEDKTPGIFFNTFHISDLNYTRYGLCLDGQNGWINDNLFIGGSIGKTEDGAAVTINHGGSNVFLKNGMEGPGTCVHIIYGGSNTFYQSRCEKATYGLVVDNGGNNIMYSNYGDTKFINNSRYITNGVIRPGIHNTCKCPSVVIGNFDENRFLKCGVRIYPTYCNLINLSYGDIVTSHLADSFYFEDGIWTPVNYRPVFTFDTTNNKKFDFGGRRVPSRVILYNSDGQIFPTDENLTQYLLADQTTTPYVSIEGYGDKKNVVVLQSPYGFEVTDKVTKIDLVYLEDEYASGKLTGFSIYTDLPCYPIRDEIIEVSDLPSNGYKGAQIFYNNTIYTYDGSKWIGFDGFALVDCLHQAVAVDKIEDNKFLRCGSRVISTYCKMINATSGSIIEDFAEGSFNLENGSWKVTSNRPVFIFNTTQNKQFAFGGLPVVKLNLYNVDGKIVLTEENVNQYISATAHKIQISNNFGTGGVQLLQVSTFTLSEEITQIELAYLGDGYRGDVGILAIQHFDIRTKLPCYPIRDKVLTVSSIPSNGYLGAEIIYNGDLYVYDGTEWKREDYVLTDEDKTEIAEQAASLIDTSLLSILGDGVIE